MKRRKIYKPRLTPMQHQTAAQRAAENAPIRPCSSDAFAFLCDMGTGKSKIILDEWAEAAINGGPQDLLIVAPAGSYRSWFEDKSDLQLSQINEHVDPALRERMVVAGWKSGGGVQRKAALSEFLRVKGRPRVLVMNVEALSSVEAARQLASEYLDQGHSYFAVDESTTIKNPRAERTKWITRLGEAADIKRIATGLLTPQSPLDAFSQFEFLDWRILGIRSFWAFRARYAIMKKMTIGGVFNPNTEDFENGRDIKIVVGYRNVEEIQEKIAPYSYRIMKEDCLDLAPKVYLTRDVEHTPEQRRIYKEVRANATAQLTAERYVTVDSIVTKMLRLHQINLGYVMDEDGLIHDIPENRTKEIFQILDEHSGKAVIWTPFIHRILTLEKRLRKEYGPQAVAMFYGGNRATRSEDERRFLGDPACKYMLATQGAGMRGNTWTVANLNIYDSNNANLEQRQQSEDRTHRKGQLLKVTNVDMIVEDTVDMKFVTMLRKKYKMSTLVTGERWRDWI
jgi:hypothetical protein